MLFDVQSSQTTITPFCATFVFLNQAQFFQTEIKKRWIQNVAFLRGREP